MKLTTASILFLTLLTAACVGPESKSPKKSAPATSGPKDDTPANNTVVDMPDDSVTNNTTTATSVCGNGIIEEGETCDGPVDESCLELGFDGGFTACSSNCQIQTDACTRASCGDGVVQAEETCDDGSDNGAYDACNGNCSGLAQYCGDRVLNGPEACDGAPPAGLSCQSFGFDGGTLACSNGCDIDTSNCATCGNGVREDGESCDDGGLNGTYGHCNALCTGTGAFCGDGVLNGPEQCDGQQLGGATCENQGAGRGEPTCSSSCTVDVTSCSLAPAPAQVIISEIMQNPAIDTDNDGEFFEVYNTTSGALDLAGCVIESSTSTGAESFTVATTVMVGPRGYAVFARSPNAPFSADYIYNGQINLNNTVDDLALVCPQPGGGSVEIDRVAYDDGLSYPDPTGASMSLNPSRLSATQNDLGSNWCAASSAYGVGDLGTPGAANDACL